MMDYNNCSKQLTYGKEFCTNLSKFNSLGNSMMKTMINNHQTNNLDLLNGLNNQQLSPINQSHHLTHDHSNQGLLLHNHSNGHHNDLHHTNELNSANSMLNNSTNGLQVISNNTTNCTNSSSTNSSHSSSSNNKQKRHRTRFTPNQLQQLEVGFCFCFKNSNLKI